MVERYLNNNWSYQDGIDSLFKYRYFDAAVTSELDFNALRHAGYDAEVDTQRPVQTDERASPLIKFITQNAVDANTWMDTIGT
jgi:hypothetical protein